MKNKNRANSGNGTGIGSAIGLALGYAFAHNVLRLGDVADFSTKVQ